LTSCALTGLTTAAAIRDSVIEKSFNTRESHARVSIVCPEAGNPVVENRLRSRVIPRAHPATSGWRSKLSGHIRFHVLDPETTPTGEQSQAADDLIQALRAYLK